ncbi:MAG: hypothetical protein J6L76_04100 [Clostridia bacterium]|nr:hypothetical protein [Clostridia bacterium]
MKACIIQPPYSRDTGLSDAYFEYKLNLLRTCDDTVDLIVLPEYSDVPCATETLEETLFYHKKYIDILLNACVETAKRCRALVFVNALSQEDGGYRNTTYVYDRTGALAGKYFKKHLPPLEMDVLHLDSDYTFQASEPYVLEIEGLRYGFLTCYDFYFYEAFAAIARQNVDIVIGCSLQRSDSHDAIEIMCRFLAYNTNAYVLRSSVSFREDSEICGASMVVSPKGAVLGNMNGKFGKMVVEFDPKDKYYKPAGYGNPPASHYEYIEYGRKPWQYRNGGASVVQFERDMPYPRICVCEDIDTLSPLKHMAAFGAAVGMGTQEIELNLSIENISTFEEILRKFAARVILNIHIDIEDLDFQDTFIEKITASIRKYDATKHVYFTASDDILLEKIRVYAPNIPCCVDWDGNPDAMAIVTRAVRLGAEKIQLHKFHFTQETVEQAHAQGLRCNLSYVDDAHEAKSYLDVGIDTILTHNGQCLTQLLTNVQYNRPVSP